MDKQTDILSEMRAKIAAHNEQIAVLTADIADTRAEIADLTGRLNSFTDYEDMTAYGDLKACLATAQDRLLMINKKMKDVMTPGQGEISKDRKWFLDKKKEVLKAYDAEAVVLLDQIEQLCNKTQDEINALTKLHEEWSRSYAADAVNAFQTYELSIPQGRFPRMRKYIKEERANEGFGLV